MLGALLLDPPIVGGVRTTHHLRVAADVLDCDRVEIANLFSIATRDVAAINEVGRSGDGWTAAQPHLNQVIQASDHLLEGWGVRGLAGPATQHKRTQLEYLDACARDIGKDYLDTQR